MNAAIAIWTPSLSGAARTNRTGRIWWFRRRLCISIQEKVHPKVLIDDLRRQTEAQEKEGTPQQLDLFADFNGLPPEALPTEFYQHDANWSNRLNY